MQLAAVFTSGTEQDTAQFAGAGSVLVNSIAASPNVNVNYTLLGSAAIGNAPLQFTVPIFVADAAYTVVAGYFRPSINGSGTVNLVHAVASTPIGSSVGIMQSTFNLSGATDVTQTALLVTGSSITTLAIGDALGIRPTTLGESSGEGVFNFVLQRI